MIDDWRGEGLIDLSIIPQDSAVRLGIGAGGLISQQIEPDTNDPRIWDTANSKMLNIQLINSNDFYIITGNPPPTPANEETHQAPNVPDLGRKRKSKFAQGKRVKFHGAFDKIENTNEATDESRTLDIPWNFDISRIKENWFMNERLGRSITMMNVDDTLPRF